MNDLYDDETDDDVKITDEAQAIIYLNHRLRDIEKLITMLNNYINIVISNNNNIIYVINNFENNNKNKKV